MDTLHPKITTTITCVKCGGTITGGDREYLVRCPYCGVEYQLSISAVVVQPADIEEKIKTLIACATDGNPRESAEACLELAKIKDPRIVAPVIDAIKKLFSRVDDYSRVGPVNDALRDILKNMDNPAAADILNGALKDKEGSIRQLAAYALEKIGDPSSAGPLIDTAHDPDDNVRSAVIGALGHFKDDGIPGILMEALEDANYSIKICSLQSLAKIRYTGAAERILGMFKDFSETRTDNGMSWAEVRYWAAHALGQIGYEPAIKPLMMALKDNDGNVRRAAYYALMYIMDVVKDDALKEHIRKARDEYDKENGA